MRTDTLAVVQNFSFTEVALVGLVLLLFFGAKRLPELFRSAGRSIGEFKRGIHEEGTVDGSTHEDDVLVHSKPTK